MRGTLSISPFLCLPSGSDLGMCVSLYLRTLVPNIWLVWAHLNWWINAAPSFAQTLGHVLPFPREPQVPPEVTCSGAPPVLSSSPSPSHMACCCSGAFIVGLPGKPHACSSVLISPEELSPRKGLCGSSSFSLTPASCRNVKGCVITVQSST